VLDPSAVGEERQAEQGSSTGEEELRELAEDALGREARNDLAGDAAPGVVYLDSHAHQHGRRRGGRAPGNTRAATAPITMRNRPVGI